MRFTAYPSEISALPHMSDGERMDYFLLRAFETEEIWALREGRRWFDRPLSDHVNGFAAGVPVMPLWCYRHYSQEAALDIWMDCRPDSMALEYFLEQEIPQFAARDIVFDIMPRAGNPGCLITPQRLASVFEGLLDAGEYRLDG